MTTALVVVALGFAPPVTAQHRHGGNGGGSGGNRSVGRATAAPRATPPPAAATAPRADNGGRRNDSGGHVERGFDNNWRGSAPPQQYSTAPRSYAAPGVPGGVYRNYGNYGNSGYRNYGSRNYNYGYRNYNYGYRNYGYRGYYYRPPVRFYTPYYAFRPRFSIGFGLWVGYPVPYAYSYYDPSYYGYPYSYGYPSAVYPSGAYPPSPYPAYPPSTTYPDSTSPQTVPAPNSIGVQPGQANTGGLSFDITPDNAEILVDGNFVGTVGEFTPSSQPLGLPAGRHQIEVRAEGYRTMSLDVNIIAGQVIPYQGSMERR